MRSSAGSSSRRARSRSRRPVSSRTIPRCTCCSGVSTSRPGAPPRGWTSCGGRCGSTRCSSRRTAVSATRSSPRGASPKRWSSGISGSGSPRARRSSWRSSTTCAARRRRPKPWAVRERGCMADEIKTLSSQLAQDPDSLVFLRLGELLRQKGQFDAAHRVALTGLERHPHLADAHDLYARVLADKRDYERAFDEWDMALRIAPTHVGALKGLAFLYFTVGDLTQAVAHLEAARRAAPDDPAIVQALAAVRGGGGPPATGAPAATGGGAAAPAGAAPPAGGRVFAGPERARAG